MKSRLKLSLYPPTFDEAQRDILKAGPHLKEEQEQKQSSKQGKSSLRPNNSKQTML